MKLSEKKKIFKNFIQEISKPVFDRFSYVDKFKFFIDNNHKHPDMLFIDSIYSVNDICEWDLVASENSSNILEMRRLLCPFLFWAENTAKKATKIQKLFDELEVIQKQNEEEENKIKAVLDEDLPEWKNRHSKFQEIVPIYYSLFPMETVEKVIVQVSRKGNVSCR